MPYSHSTLLVSHGRVDEPSRILDADEISVRTSLEMAACLAKAGDRHQARILCAAAIFDHQPLITARKGLLRLALYTLLISEAFKLISRLVVAMTGSRLLVDVRCSSDMPAVPHYTKQTVDQIMCEVDPRWLGNLSSDDDFLDHWSVALLSGQPRADVRR